MRCDGLNRKLIKSIQQEIDRLSVVIKSGLWPSGQHLDAATVAAIRWSIDDREKMIKNLTLIKSSTPKLRLVT